MDLREVLYKVVVDEYKSAARVYNVVRVGLDKAGVGEHIQAAFAGMVVWVGLEMVGVDEHILVAFAGMASRGVLDKVGVGGHKSVVFVLVVLDDVKYHMAQLEPVDAWEPEVSFAAVFVTMAVFEGVCMMAQPENTQGIVSEILVGALAVATESGWVDVPEIVSFDPLAGARIEEWEVSAGEIPDIGVLGWVPTGEMAIEPLAEIQFVDAE